MLSDRAANYIAHHHIHNKRPLDHLANKWCRTYPADAVSISEVEDFIAKVKALMKDGQPTARAIHFVLEGKPKLTVLKKEAPAKKKVPKKKK